MLQLRQLCQRSTMMAIPMSELLDVLIYVGFWCLCGACVRLLFELVW